MFRYAPALYAAALTACALALPARAAAVVVTFDDLPVTGDFANPMPAGYGGIDWQGNNWDYLVCSAAFPCPQGSAYPYTPHSYPGMATVDSGEGLTMQFGFTGGAAVFNGAWVTTFDGDYFGYTLLYHGVVVHDTGHMPSNAAPSFAASGYGGLVDQVVIIASDIGDWAIDDLSYTSPSVVPEPASPLLLLAGLATVAGVAARRRPQSRGR